MRHFALAMAMLLPACGAGSLDDGEGRQPLRTALFATWQVDEQAVAGVFVSNGEFPCTLTPTNDASEAEQQQVELLAAACREDARHALLEYSRPLSLPWGGAYAGGADRSARGVAGRAFAVLEAVLIGEDGLSRQFAVTEFEEQTFGIGGQGSLEEPADGRLRGHYAFEDALEIRFDARACQVDDRVFRALMSNGRLPCPIR